MSRESEADRTGQRLTRDERKALRIEDLKDCTPERRAEIKTKTEKTVSYLAECAEKNERGGTPRTIAIMFYEKNAASHILTLECLEAIAKESK